ncbi:MAG TPA: serine hydrolase domain-containing protein [Terracidiphilus sp.]
MRRLRGAALAAAPFFGLLFAVAQVPTTKAPSASAPVTHPPAIAPTTTVPISAHPLDQADLAAFFDGILDLQLERSDIGGASVLVMKDGNTLLEKGYGYADVKARKPVDPGSTIFRLASISKLFTWVSVMQLEEQGKLNLDADINQYLDFKIRAAFDKPITLRNLMTHTGGFEETLDDIIILDPKKATTLRDYVIHNQPMRIFPPGEIPAYSNYGVGVASYIVQRVSGEPFEQYVNNHIFAPLGMTHSSFYQPLQKPLAGLPSEGYRDNTTKPPVGFEIFNPVGAGGISSSAGDMGRFGQALLNGGELDGKRILKPETLALMWTPQFQASSQLPPICMGFYQDWRNHLRWIGHEGDLIAFHSLFFVEPTQKIVLFVSYNSAGGGGLPRPEIIDFFSDRYFPGAPQAQFLKTSAKDLKDIEGTYQVTRRDDTTKFKLSGLFSQRSASVDKDGVLTIAGSRDLRGHPIKWRPIAKDLWQAQDEQPRIFGIRDKNNKIVRIAVDFPGVQFERVPWYENKSWVLIALFSSLGIFVLVILASIVRTWRRLFQRRRPKPEPQPGTIWLTAAPRLAAFLWIALLGALMVYFMIKGDDLMPPTPAWYKWFALENFFAMVAIVVSTLAVIAGIKSWGRDLRFITRLKFSLVALACAFVSWFAIHWHLLGPTTRI